MNGFERIRTQAEGQKNVAFNQVVDYLLTREDMEQNYLKEEKNLKGMSKFIKSKGLAHAQDGWNFITNEVVYAWAIMYFSLPNSFLKINEEKENKKDTNNTKKEHIKNNVVSLEKAKKDLENRKEVEQLSLFGGDGE